MNIRYRLSFTLLAVSIGLPLLLVVHSVFAARELSKMRSIYLRDRAATTAARLELMAPAQLQSADFEQLLDSDAALQGIRVFGPADQTDANAAVEAIRGGHELYHIEEANTDGNAVFRAYIPFHSQGQVHVARIDVALNAPDFLLVHARHNMLMALVSGSVLLLVSLFALWSMHRATSLERRHLETERLAQLGSLSAVLAHEIRNPLGAIKGFAQLARRDAEAHQSKPLDAIVRECLRLEALVNSLLLYGRPLKPVVRRTNWPAFATDLEAHAREAIGPRPIEFTANSDVSDFSTDPEMLKQALLNLIRNSVEAIPEGQPGKVSLHAAAAGNGRVVIAVEDDGPGLPETVRSRLFSPFVTTKASGTGLGLPISKKLVESLGGSLQLLPRTPRGTRAELAFYGTNSGH